MCGLIVACESCAIPRRFVSNSVSGCECVYVGEKEIVCVWVCVCVCMCVCVCVCVYVCVNVRTYISVCV